MIYGDKKSIMRGKKEKWVSMSKEIFTKLNIPSCDSWTFSHIMPGVVRHNNPAKEHSKNAT